MSIRFARLFAWVVVLLAACGIALSAPADPPKSLRWLSGLAEAQARALAERKPLLVRVGAEWCPACRKLAAEIDKPSVQDELARWTLCSIDSETSQEAVEQLNVSGIPALRIRTPSGELVASRDGAMPAEALVAWLQRHYQEASAEPDDVLLATGEPDAAAVARLVGQLAARNAAVREAAARRLLPYPAAARVEVAAAFAEGRLATRLAALELLQHWRAPLAEMDPWQPESLKPGQLALLRQWAEKAGAEAIRPQQPSPQRLAAAAGEIDRMLKADETEAAAIAERLAGLGAALLPQVTARLRQAAADQDRQRLLTLRYRLVAADSLVLRWPGGLARLAAIDSRRRQHAAEELAGLATAAEEPLLAELFSDPDPLVREISLRGLQHIGGQAATAALVRLLADPEPNVRAAVLKQLEEKPQPGMARQVCEYLKREKDADLVVHGIRVLSQAGGAEGLRTLMALLGHESWQVRAEAAEAMGKIRLQGQGGDENDAAMKLQADAYIALINLLDDGDGFVVSRAVEGLGEVDMAVAVEPLVRAARKHPELAAKIVPILAGQTNMRAKALPHLRKFFTDANPLVRAAALEGLYGARPDQMADDLATAIEDRSHVVRIAAAQIIFRIMEQQRYQAAEQQLRKRSGVGGLHGGPVVVQPDEGLLSTVVRFLTGGSSGPAPAGAKPPETGKKPAAEKEPATEKKPDAEKKPMPKRPEGDSPIFAERKLGQSPGAAAPPKAEPPSDPWDDWLEQYYAGRHRPQWITRLRGPLEKMLRAETAKERMAAATVLVPLGRADSALPEIRKLLDAHHQFLHQAAEILPWLTWKERLPLFRQLCGIAGNNNLLSMVYAMSRVPDRRAVDVYWQMLADEKLSLETVAALERGLMMSYFGVSSPYSLNQTTMKAADPRQRELFRAVKHWATSGRRWQRLVALALVTYTADEGALQLAEQLADDAKLDAELRSDAFQIALVMESDRDARHRALAALKHADPQRRKLALEYLTSGRTYLGTLREELMLQGGGGVTYFSHGGAPNLPKPPIGLEAAQVRPLLAETDPQAAAEAGYLLALLEQPDGLETLLRFVHGKDDWRWEQLAVRAIAVLDDQAHVAVLKEIYAGLEHRGSEVRDFYWTIRLMTGPEILKLRKQIRDEVGMANLR
jgi:HEAT repeat protein/thiol-disulfide isomerase/thioredoxin